MKDLIADHFVCCFLVVNIFIQGLQGVSELLGFEFLVDKYIFEFGNHSVEDGGGNLFKNGVKTS